MCVLQSFDERIEPLQLEVKITVSDLLRSRLWIPNPGIPVHIKRVDQYLRLPDRVS